MDVVDQETMNRLFAVTDELGIDREAIQVPLAMEGEGAVRQTAAGKLEIQLPARDRLDPFLAELPEKLE